MATTRMFGVAKAETPVAVVGVVVNGLTSDDAALLPLETSDRVSGASVSAGVGIGAGVGSFAISDVPDAMRRSINSAPPFGGAALPGKAGLAASADDLRVITRADLRSLNVVADPRATRFGAMPCSVV